MKRENHRFCFIRRGFTLIELMVVIVVIGILAAIAIPNYIALKNRALEASVKANMQAVQMAVEEFSTLVQGVYPGDLDTRVDQVEPAIGPPLGDMSLAAGVRIPPFPPEAFLKPHPGLKNPFEPHNPMIENLLTPPPPVPPAAFRGCVYFSTYMLNGTTPGVPGQRAYSYRISAFGDSEPLTLTLP